MDGHEGDGAALSPEAFRALAGGLPALCWMAGPDGAPLWVSDAFARAAGAPAAGVVAGGWAAVVEPTAAAGVLERVRAGVAAGRAFAFPLPLRGEGGRARALLARASPAPGADGTAFWCGVCEEAAPGGSEAERREGFLRALSNRLRREGDPEAVLTAANRALGEALGALRVGYGEIDPERATLTFTTDWTDEVVSNAGTFPLASFGEGIAAEHRAGRTFVSDDLARDPRIGPEHLAAYARWGVGALLAVPLVKDSRFVAVLSVQSAAPRAWSAEEVGLVEEVAERTWAALERARAEARLREGDAQFRLLADQIPFPCWIAGPDGQGLWFSRRWRERVAAAGPDGHWLDAVDPAEQAEAARLWRRAVEAEAPFEVRCALTGAEGDRRVVLLRAEPLKDGAGRVVRWFGVGTDLTEQMEAERRQGFMLEFNDRVRRQAGPDAVLREALGALGRHLGTHRVGYAEADVEADTLTVLMDWNDEGMGTIVGRYPLMAFGPRNIAALARGETVRLEDRLDHPLFGPEDQPALQAMRIDAAITVPLVRDGRLMAVLSAHHAKPRRWTPDEVRLVEEVAERTWAVLERARAEAHLRDSEARLAAFLAHAPSAMYLKDAEGRFLLANGEMARRLGAPVERVLGRRFEELASPEAAARAKAREREARRTGRPWTGEETVEVEGETHHAMETCFAVPDGDGRPAWVGGVIVDVTAQRRAEAELERSREALYQSEKLTALGSLLAGVAHELNNPLAVVVANALMLEEDAEGTPHAEDAARIRRAAERCAKIVRVFLAMARQRRPERAEIDVNEVVRGALDLAAYGLRTAGVAVEADLAPDLPRFLADGDQLHQVLANLIVNAQQAMLEKQGPRRLTVRTRLGAGGRVEVDLADTGPGVAPEARRRIFEPFYTTKPQGAGTGVGLTFSLGVIEAHGGTLELAETSPAGTRFRIALPVASGAAPGPVTGSPPEGAAAPAERLTALVVDDEAELGEALARMLRREGYAVTAVASGRAAQAALTAGPFDLIVSDLRMPDLDGPALFAWLRSERPALVTRVAFVTGDTLGADAVRFLAAAGRPVIEKPFSRASLRRALDGIDRGPAA